MAANPNKRLLLLEQATRQPEPDKPEPGYIVVDSPEEAETLALEHGFHKVYIRGCSPDDWPDPRPAEEVNHAEKS